MKELQGKKKGSHDSKFSNAQDLPKTHMADRCTGLTNRKPNKSRKANVKGNVYKSGDHIISSGIKTCQQTEGKNMVSRLEMQE